MTVVWALRSSKLSSLMTASGTPSALVIAIKHFSFVFLFFQCHFFQSLGFGVWVGHFWALRGVQGTDFLLEIPTCFLLFLFPCKIIGLDTHFCTLRGVQTIGIPLLLCSCFPTSSCSVSDLLRFQVGHVYIS